MANSRRSRRVSVSPLPVPELVTMRLGEVWFGSRSLRWSWWVVAGVASSAPHSETQQATGPRSARWRAACRWSPALASQVRLVPRVPPRCGPWPGAPSSQAALAQAAGVVRGSAGRGMLGSGGLEVAGSSGALSNSTCPGTSRQWSLDGPPGNCCRITLTIVG